MGSPSGVYPSGFEEEFELARRRKRDTGAPEIWLFFKDMEPGRLEDPGEQLQRVIAFRQGQVAAKELLFKSFHDAQHWDRVLRNFLTEYLLDLSAQAAEATSAPATEATATPPATETVPTEELPAELPAYQQVVDTLDAVGGAARDVEHRFGNVGPVEAARLYLLSAAILNAMAVSTEPLGAHEINFAYRHRAEITPVGDEALLILRTLLLDRHDLAPGWFWFRRLAERFMADMLASRAFADKNENVRIRALEMLTELRLGPRSEDADDPPFEQLLADDSPRVRKATVAYLAEVGDTDDLEAMGRLAADADPSVRTAVVRARLSILARADVGGAFTEALALPEGALPDIAEAVKPWLHEVIRAGLIRALHHPNASIRQVAARELLDRGALTRELAEPLVQDSSPIVQAAGYRALARAGERLDPAAIRKSFEPQGPPTLLALGPHRVDVDDLLFEVYGAYTADELVQRLDWYALDGPIIYKKLAVDYFDRFGERVRADARDEFTTLRRESQERMRANLGEELAARVLAIHEGAKVEEFVRGSYVAGALAGVARHGKAGDADIARRWLGASGEVKRGAVEALARFGNASDVPALVAAAKRALGEEQELAVRAALGMVPGRDGALAVLDATEDPAVMKVALRALRAFEPDGERVESLLGFKDDSIRLAALSWVVERYNAARLETILTAYFERGFYYYNVVCWLDRVLYAPPPLRQFYKGRLLAL